MKIKALLLPVTCGIAIFGVGFGLWWKNSVVVSELVKKDRVEAKITVKAVEAKRGSVQAWVFAEGTARSLRREYLMFESAGRIAYISPGPDGKELREGDSVKANTVLARQDQRRYFVEIEVAESTLREAETGQAVAEAELEQARTNEELAKTTFSRFQVLLQQESASKQEFDESQAEAAKASAGVSRAQSQVAAAKARVEASRAQLTKANVDLEGTELRTPIEGVVAYLNIEEGLYFTPNLIRTDDETAALQTIPIIIIDPSEFEVTVNLPSYERQKIQKGQQVLIVTDESRAKKLLESEDSNFLSNSSMELGRLPDLAVPGEVFSVNPAITPGGRAIQARVRSSATGDRLQDGMFVTVWIATEQKEDVVVAPVNTFIYRDNKPFVFVANPTTELAELRSVELGLQGFGTQEIISGVEAGESLVTQGRFQLVDRAKISLLPTGGVHE